MSDGLVDLFGGLLLLGLLFVTLAIGAWLDSRSYEDKDER